ncbi:hypothetical protein ARMGADRAFT_1005360 [Armillaria gallica]|uniref:Uncharacterized protein n=1 Tax=Armillaria gallica TaxID=47427 RepID=A0A2H3ET52_ARMGA|nr:hypothetical protein ARMGADRAFT_1005360 [Armillaria gallica]
MTASMEKNDIYAVLTSTNIAGAFHWSLYLVVDSSQGYKFHATNKIGTAPWQYECVLWVNPQSEDSMPVTFTKIGQVPEDWDYSYLDYFLNSIPMCTPDTDRAREPRFTCRVWFKEAIRTLHAAEMFVKCADVDALERDLVTKATAAEYMRRSIPLPRFLTTNAVDAEGWL